MRVDKWIAIIFYVISGFCTYIEINGIITGIIRGSHLPIKYYIFVIAPSTVFFLIGLINHMNYRKTRKIYGQLLDGKNIDKIDYIIKWYKFNRGTSYYRLEFYIEGKRFQVIVTKMGCRNNKNNEYYLTPVYDRKGRVKDFVVYMDKENLDHKSASYRLDLERYKEMQRLKEENIEEKEEKNEKAIRPKPKLKHIKDNTETTKTQEVSINKIRKKTSRKMRKESESEKEK